MEARPQELLGNGNCLGEGGNSKCPGMYEKDLAAQQVPQYDYHRQFWYS